MILEVFDKVKFRRDGVDNWIQILYIEDELIIGQLDDPNVGYYNFYGGEIIIIEANEILNMLYLFKENKN